MATVFRVGTFRVVVFSNDHPPAHVHAVGDGSARFALGRGPDDVRLVEQRGVPAAELRRIAKTIIERHAECLAEWRRIHGDP